MTKKNQPNFSWMVATFLLVAILVTSATTSTIEKPDSNLDNIETVWDKVNDEACIGEVRMFGGNYAPRGYAFCDGQQLAIASHTALFSILGCTFGGDCRTTFNLPNLQGKLAVGVGTGPGLPPIVWGQQFGVYTHPVSLTPNGTSTAGPPGRSGNVNVITGASFAENQLSTVQPYQVINYIIALEGIYCSRS